MNKTIEMSIESPDGIIDCQLEPERINGGLIYGATILYPNIVDGFSRSEIYCYNLKHDPETRSYHFDAGEEGIHPKVKKLEGKISNTIISFLKESDQK